MNDYQKSIIVQKPVSEVFAAITEHISDWWTNDLTGSASHIGDRFMIAFGMTKKTMEISEVRPNEKVVWTCIEAYIDMASLENKSEWVGTELIWKLSTDQQTTILTFLHKGLNQNFQCYDVCEIGWNTFLASLETFLKTGQGNPHLKKV
ncbi:SRPBCC domain-containing protein [Dyadobacter sp. 3J3]|uniref:SRPBCC family protein n=1 Tax=Dyadobacter sp. 3J3 TaxID=2606600 RepID=UPI0013586E96|nr:SRPBCC domain-containing protein [Dyadobacter sp. 3J3]